MKKRLILKISEFLDDKEINIWFKTKESNNKALIWLPGYQDYYYHFHVEVNS